MGSFLSHLVTSLLDLKDRKGESVKPPKSAEEVDSFPFPGLHGTVEARSGSGDTPDDPEPKKATRNHYLLEGSLAQVRLSS